MKEGGHDLFVRPAGRTDTVNSPLLSGWICCLQERKETWKGTVFTNVLSGIFQRILSLTQFLFPLKTKE